MESWFNFLFQRHINEENVLNEISIEKDVDGFHPHEHWQTWYERREIHYFSRVHQRVALNFYHADWHKCKEQKAVVVGRPRSCGGPQDTDDGFNHEVYTKSDIDKRVGSLRLAFSFRAIRGRYFGYLVSHKKYIVSIDDDCVPQEMIKGQIVDHGGPKTSEPKDSATPFFFNTLYDPYCAVQTLLGDTHSASRLG
ncbi:hypothetical protein IFM89_018626 [Coptis chinensis]|uniref:Uncharacterized protein n=1 Tax=Coptis chinensis TaxID=261450 RepID=A0A835H3U2_9MAGN|nr:hypothetical protein IFM89_018626 [Coptis chinensis]